MPIWDDSNVKSIETFNLFRPSQTISHFLLPTRENENHILGKPALAPVCQVQKMFNFVTLNSLHALICQAYFISGNITVNASYKKIPFLQSPL